MKTATLDNVRVADLPRGSGVTGALRNTAQAVRTWNKRRLAIRELHALSDRQLADIGLIRGDIESVVDKMLAK